MITHIVIIFNILYNIIFGFFNPHFQQDKYIENKNIVNSFDKLPNVVFHEWKKYKFNNIKNSFDIDDNINKYLELNKKEIIIPHKHLQSLTKKYISDKISKKNAILHSFFQTHDDYLNINIKLNDHIEELDENIVKQNCVDILPHRKLNNLKYVYIFTDGSSTHLGAKNMGGSGMILLHPDTNHINCFALKCKNCDSLSSEYNPFVFLIDHWFEIIPENMAQVIIFCDNQGVVDNINHIFDILHHNIYYNNINICSRYSFKNMHEKWCYLLIKSINKYSQHEKHIIVSKLQLFWIKAHVMFLWNILADAISKWSRMCLT